MFFDSAWYCVLLTNTAHAYHTSLYSSLQCIYIYIYIGADVFRLNFSHGEHAQKKELLDIIRSVEAKYDHPIAILGDLQGPKLRVGQVCIMYLYNVNVLYEVSIFLLTIHTCIYSILFTTMHMLVCKS